MGEKKKNPRSRPATGEDVNRARAQGQMEGLDLAIAIFLFVLADRHNATEEELKVFWSEVNDVSDSINRGYVTEADIRRVLKDEYDISTGELRRSHRKR